MTINIKIFSDYTCPFCYVGKGILEQLKKEYNIKEEWVGLELHPDTPEDGVNLVDIFGDKVDIMLGKLAKSGEAYGIKFGDLKHMPNSHNALEAAEYARVFGKFKEYHEALMNAYFTETKDIGDIEVLKEIGEKVGLKGRELAKNVEERSFEEKLEFNKKYAHDMKVNNTPMFVINNEYKIGGIQPIEVYKNLLNAIDKKKI